MSKAQNIENDVIYDVIHKPLITEKSTILGQFNKVTFRVRTDATKKHIKEAVEKLFNVEVKAVNTINQQGKVKRFRGRIGKRNDFKKAIVTLAEGQTIDVMGGVK